MQVAANPFSAHLPHSHYHAYYQLPPPGPQDHDLKRQYLALLPPQQIIEICLAFDLHAPPYVRSSVWPPDINAAIAGLQKPAQQPPPAAEPEKPVEEPAKDVMNSLKSPPPAEPSSEAQENAPPATEPQPPDREKTTSPAPSTPPALTATETTATPPVNPPESVPPPSTASETTEKSDAVESTAQPAPATPPAAAQTPQPPAHPQYPTAYAYAHPQATYPHAPYYTSHGGYSYPYASYATMSAYPQAPPAAYPPQPTMYNSMMQTQHPPQHEGVVADDLPSYEEMIVEALTGCGDPEGWAPKDLFLWMASRYPLQSNFRPSASQALQKAFKRGRFEKSSNGKYRLNATWNGGNTSRRTTRRPQTQNSQSTGSSAPAPPFTNAPLVHHHHASTTPAASTPSQPAYTSTPYGYSYPGYPGYTAPQPHASTSTAPGTIAGAQAPSGAATDATKTTTAAAPTITAPPGSDNDTAAAYEAAQNILSAINFGDLYHLAPEEQNEGGAGAASGTAATGSGKGDQAPTEGITGVEELLSHVQAMLASAEHNAAAATASTSGGSATTTAAPHATAEPAPPQSPGDPRAELQAQLALLAAQLAEHARLEEAEGAQVPAMQPLVQPLPQPHRIIAPAPVQAPMAILSPPSPQPPAPEPVVPQQMVVHPTPTPNVAETPAEITPPPPPPPAPPEAIPEEDEESDDDDMEEVI
ncbi:hypothetical protein BDN70DRAFT_25023 [Pholiota conissans]|uniref:Histone H1 n=1 Tax=Pholiota conissans TaxID=109636 RepID=A0A9P5ZAZ6_9AGAR|nr:hypothetical protein BDN70DRAFT_25023 [Pholiota conissans]